MYGENRYEALGGNPVNGLDPVGLEPRDPTRINCLGYATGEDCFIEPDLDEVVEAVKALGEV